MQYNVIYVYNFKSSSWQFSLKSEFFFSLIVLIINYVGNKKLMEAYF